MLNFLLYYVMLHVDAGDNPARHCHLVPGAAFGPIPGLQKTLELREAIFNPEMIWEAVPQCRCSKSERVFTVPCILHKGVNIILDTTIYWTFHRSEHQGMAKKTFKFAAAT
jgi:hypothetical protein